MRWLYMLGLLAAAPVSAQTTDVYLLASLHGLHAREESFGYDALRDTIAEIRPDVVVLEVTPEELAGKLETRGRPEYPRIVWPLLAARGAPRAYAMEAGQPLYAELTGAASRAWGDFGRDRPDRNKALDAHGDASDTALLAYWDSPARVQDQVTQSVARAAAQLSEALVPATAPIQRRWEGAMIAVAKQAIAENPGKRILILASYRNRFVFEDGLAGMAGARLIDMAAHLDSKAGTR